MTELVVCCISTLALIWLWGAWKRACLEFARDQIFDLRDQARAFFVARPGGLQDPAYVKLRSLLNGYLRWADSLRYLGMRYYYWATPPHMLREMIIRFQVSMLSTDPKVNEFVGQIRSKAARKIQRYLLLSSTAGLVVLIFTLLLILPRLAYHLHNGIRSAIALRCERIPATRSGTLEVTVGQEIFAPAAA